MKRAVITTIAVVAGFLVSSASAASESAADGAARPKKLLVVTTTAGFRHSSIPTAEKVIAELGERSGHFTVHYIRQPERYGEPTRPANLKPDASAEEKAQFAAVEAAYNTAKAAALLEMEKALAKLNPDALKEYDAVVFANTTGELPIPNRQGFLDWIKGGGAFIGLHSAADTLRGWPEYVEMLGAAFLHHGEQVGVECLNHDEGHPATEHIGARWRIPQEEIYLFEKYEPSRVHELLTLDSHPNEKVPGHFPVSWTREYGKGRVFYTSLGHREDIWDADPQLKDRKNPVEVSTAYQEHILGGIRWALRLIEKR